MHIVVYYMVDGECNESCSTAQKMGTQHEQRRKAVELLQTIEYNPFDEKGGGEKMDEANREKNEKTRIVYDTKWMKIVNR